MSQVVGAEDLVHAPIQVDASSDMAVASLDVGVLDLVGSGTVGEMKSEMPSLVASL